MKFDDEDLLVLVGLYLLFEGEKLTTAAVKSIERGGARIYEATHATDSAHSEDLPAKALKKATIVNLAKSVGFVDPNLAAAVAMAESGGIPNAEGDVGLGATGPTSFGLWQIHLPAHPEYTREEMVNPLRNAQAAYEISNGGHDFSPWSTYKSGAYKRHL